MSVRGSYASVRTVLSRGLIAALPGTRGFAHCRSSHCFLRVETGRQFTHVGAVWVFRTKWASSIIGERDGVFPAKSAISGYEGSKPDGTANARRVVISII